MEKKKNIVTKVNDGFYITEKTITWIVFSIMILLLLIQVFCRYVFKMPLAWAEETIRYTYIAVSFVGAAVALREKSHITIDILPTLIKKIKNDKRREVVAHCVDIFSSVVQLVFFILLSMWMFKYTIDLQVKNQITTANQWPMYLMSLPVAVSCVLCIIHSALNGLESIISLFGLRKKGKVVE